MSETKIPVYRRQITPEIGFTTFSSEGTELLGTIVVPGRAWIHLDALQIPGPEDRYLDEFWPELAMAQARAGTDGLRFEPVTSHGTFVEYHKPAEVRPFVKPAMDETNRKFAENVREVCARNAKDIREKTGSPRVRAFDGKGDVPQGERTSDGRYWLGVKPPDGCDSPIVINPDDYVIGNRDQIRAQEEGGYPIPKEIAEPFLAAIDAGQKVFYGEPFTFPEGYSEQIVKPDWADEQSPTEPKTETWRDRKPLL